MQGGEQGVGRDVTRLAIAWLRDQGWMQTARLMSAFASEASTKG